MGYIETEVPEYRTLHTNITSGTRALGRLHNHLPDLPGDPVGFIGANLLAYAVVGSGFLSSLSPSNSRLRCFFLSFPEVEG